MTFQDGLSDYPLVDGGIESLSLKVGDRRAHYLKAGSGYPIVLLHGGASDCRDWLGTIDVLSVSHAVYAPDLIGYGLSDRSKDGYYLSDFVDFVLGFTEALGLNRLALAGHSLGGRVCLEIALRYPARVSKLVLVNAVGFSRLAWWGALMGTALWGVRRILRRPQPFPKFLRERGGYADWVCLDELSDLKAPTLVVWSRRDPYYSLSGATRAVELMPNASLEVLDCQGHAPHVRRRDAFNRLLMKFLARE